MTIKTIWNGVLLYASEKYSHQQAKLLIVTEINREDVEICIELI